MDNSNINIQERLAFVSEQAQQQRDAISCIPPSLVENSE